MTSGRREPGAVRRGPGATVIAALVLVTLGGVLLIGYYVLAQFQRHSYAPGQAPPTYVSVRKGATYWVGVPGGVRYEQSLGQPPSALQCTAAQRGGPEYTLEMTRETGDSKMVNLIGSFQAPVTGQVHVTCSGLRRVYIDNASASPSGLLLVIGGVSLTIGVPLLLSGLRSVSIARTARRDPLAVGG